LRIATISQRLCLIADGGGIDVNNASGGRFGADAAALYPRWQEFADWAAAATLPDPVPFAAESLGSPSPSPRQVFGVGLNYSEHIAESGLPKPETAPPVFTKFPSCITGPDAAVRLPDGKVDWEVEIVAVVGTGGRHVPRDQAWDAIAGVTLGQDLSERVRQLAGKPAQFSLGKSFPGFGPTGPVAVSPDEFVDRDDIGFECLLDGQTMQKGRTSNMIFPIDDLVARLSSVCTLLPGDLIFTGTPEGVGNRRTPPRYLRPGETLVSRADGIGEIRQTFVAGSS
jgi:2-keto-4-pentenoate hydratase/2-oxohepta-3-ene-1,7-dioic acid hydratase in catechol pathway